MWGKREGITLFKGQIWKKIHSKNKGLTLRSIVYNTKWTTGNIYAGWTRSTPICQWPLAGEEAEISKTGWKQEASHPHINHAWWSRQKCLLYWMGKDVFPRIGAWWMNANTITMFTGLSPQHDVSSTDLLSSHCLQPPPSSCPSAVSGPWICVTAAWWNDSITTALHRRPPLDTAGGAWGKCLQFQKPKVYKTADMCLASITCICCEIRGRWGTQGAAVQLVAWVLSNLMSVLQESWQWC